MRGGEGQFVKPFERKPHTVEFGIRVIRPAEMRAKGFERNAVAGDGMFDYAERLGGCKSEAEAASGGARIARVLRSDFNIQEFPEVGVDATRRALADEKLAVALDDESDEVALSSSGAFAEIGKSLLQIVFSREAQFIHGANVASRRARCADERAEFHQGLVQMGARRCMMRDA